MAVIGLTLLDCSVIHLTWLLLHKKVFLQWNHFCISPLKNTSDNTCWKLWPEIQISLNYKNFHNLCGKQQIFKLLFHDNVLFNVNSRLFYESFISVKEMNKMFFFFFLEYFSNFSLSLSNWAKGYYGRDRMVIGIITTNAISTYHH